jgi:hypothetical protein
MDRHAQLPLAFAVASAVGWVPHMRNPSLSVTRVMGIAALNPSYEIAGDVAGALD